MIPRLRMACPREDVAYWQELERDGHTTAAANARRFREHADECHQDARDARAAGDWLASQDAMADGATYSGAANRAEHRTTTTTTTTTTE